MEQGMTQKTYEKHAFSDYDWLIAHLNSRVLEYAKAIAQHSIGEKFRTAVGTSTDSHKQICGMINAFCKYDVSVKAFKMICKKYHKYCDVFAIKNAVYMLYSSANATPEQWEETKAEYMRQIYEEV